MTDAEHPAEEGARMSIGEHLDELRTRIIRAIIATILCAVVAFIFASDLFSVILKPAYDALEPYKDDGAIVQTGVAQGFLLQIKLSVIIGLFFASPFIAYQVWAFIGAGLYTRERRYIKMFALSTYAFFLAGVAFAYFLVLPFGLKFFLSIFGTMDPPGAAGKLPPVKKFLSIDEYLSFFLMICIVMGMVFQLPLIMVALDRIGIVTADVFAHYRRHCILGTFVVAALLTPPDPVTQVLVATSLIVLFEFGIWFSRFTRTKKKSEET